MLLVGLVVGGAIGAISAGIAVQKALRERINAREQELASFRESYEELAIERERELQATENEWREEVKNVERRRLEEVREAERRRKEELSATEKKAEQRRVEELSVAEERRKADLTNANDGAARILKAARESAEAQLNALRDQLEEQKRHEAQMEVRLKDSFKVLADESLDANKKKFLEETKTQVAPLEKINKDLREEILRMETKRESAYEALSMQAEFLKAETTRLTNTLANPQVRGSWGELKLRQVLELAGLTKYVDFEEQVQVKVDGDRLRPDAVVRLPNKGMFPIDAKLPLDAFLAAVEEVDDEKKNALLDKHVAAVHSRLKELGSKAYFRAFDSPEFVVMFLPIEAAFYAAIQRDATLIDQAVKEHRVILCGPMTLVSLLMAVAFGWREVELYSGAREIARLGRELVDRTETVARYAGALSGALSKAVEAHNQFVNSLQSRLLVTAHRFEELGARGPKDIPDVEEVLIPV